MKLSKSLLQAMLIAVTAGTLISCEKPKVDEVKKPLLQTPRQVVSHSAVLPGAWDKKISFHL